MNENETEMEEEKEKEKTYEYDHIIVAVHGVGDQMRNETVRSVATRLARMPTLAEKQILIAPQPLGYFHSEKTDEVKIALLDKITDLKCPLTKAGFTEVYWADIPDIYVNEGHTLEETKAWARTVVSRARAVFLKASAAGDVKSLTEDEQRQLREPDFSLAGEVLDEIVDALYVIENLLFLADKAGIGKFDLRDILEKYVGDVQMVTEFTIARNNIIGRFHRAMEQIADKCKHLHIVAHSEGTVVSFLGMLHAMSGNKMVPGDDRKDAKIETGQPLPPWLRKVRGYMTIGSPIDKHILLWPELFDGLSLTYKEDLGEGQIVWRNYFDYGDPIGFKLNTAWSWLDDHKCKVFDFELKKDNIGFSRYLFPGKAHVDYWIDPEVFEHFVSQAVFKEDFEKDQVEKPRSRWITAIVSPSIPYLVSFLILFVGTVLFYRTVTNFMHPPQDMVQNYISLMTLGDIPQSGTSGMELLHRSLGVTLLIAGTTLLARWPRLAKKFFWLAMGAIAFVIGCISYWQLVPIAARKEIGILFLRNGINPTLGVFEGALLVAIIGMTVVIKPASFDLDDNKKPALEREVHKKVAKILRLQTSRRLRWFAQGMRPLIFCGAVAIALLVSYQIWHPRRGSDLVNTDILKADYFAWSTNAVKATNAAALESPAMMASLTNQAETHAELTKQVFEVQPSIWPVILSGVAFLYLWWLSALVFDLAFVWQRYIRQSKMLDRMHQWRILQKKLQEKATAKATPA